jgi:hypothetical protein
MPQAAPYGSWTSPLAAERAVAAGIGLGDVSFDGDSRALAGIAACREGPQRDHAAQCRRHAAGTDCSTMECAQPRARIRWPCLPDARRRAVLQPLRRPAPVPRGRGPGATADHASGRTSLCRPVRRCKARFAVGRARGPSRRRRAAQHARRAAGPGRRRRRSRRRRGSRLLRCAAPEPRRHATRLAVLEPPRHALGRLRAVAGRGGRGRPPARRTAPGRQPRRGGAAAAVVARRAAAFHQRPQWLVEPVPLGPGRRRGAVPDGSRVRPADVELRPGHLWLQFAAPAGVQLRARRGVAAGGAGHGDLGPAHAGHPLQQHRQPGGVGGSRAVHRRIAAAGRIGVPAASGRRPHRDTAPRQRAGRRPRLQLGA